MPQPPPPESHLEHGWKLIQAYYDWESRGGRTALEAGTRCKILAYFHEQFLGRFLSSPGASQISLDTLTAEVLDAYLGGWYLAESGLAGPEDLEWQLASLGGLVVFLGQESRYRSSAADWRVLEHHLENADRFRRRLRQWEEFRRQTAGAPDWIQQQERWISSDW